MWSSVLDPNYSHNSWEKNENSAMYRKILLESINQKTILLGIKDHLTSGDYDPKKESMPVMISNIKNMISYHSDKHFVLFTSLENLESYLDNSNLSIVPWGGDITNHQKEYLTLNPILDKNFSSVYNYLSLNRNRRIHRETLLALLYGLDLEEHGLISCMFKNIIKLYSNDKLFVRGYEKFKNSELKINDDIEIYTNGNNDNVTNFKNRLSSYYQNTFVEIITETSFNEKCYNLTEKTLNSIYGCCFPILLCSQGSVDFLRTMGMDMFDDIIDHRYDRIKDPGDRLYRAITDNKELLSNNSLVKDLWKKNQQRFLNNVDFAKHKLYNYYAGRTTKQFTDLIHDHNL
jgi:hypothetical protein